MGLQIKDLQGKVNSAVIHDFKQKNLNIEVEFLKSLIQFLDKKNVQCLQELIHVGIWDKIENEKDEEVIYSDLFFKLITDHGYKFDFIDDQEVCI